jgi:hypothetical protein
MHARTLSFELADQTLGSRPWTRFARLAAYGRLPIGLEEEAQSQQVIDARIVRPDRGNMPPAVTKDEIGYGGLDDALHG